MPRKPHRGSCLACTTLGAGALLGLPSAELGSGLRPGPVASLGNSKIGAFSDTSAEMCVALEDKGRNEVVWPPNSSSGRTLQDV